MKKALIYMVSIFLAAMSLLCMFAPKKEISFSERRELNQFPNLSIETLISGEFMDDFEEYAADQFPFREQWRSLKARLTLNLFQQSDNNKLYVADGHASKLEYPLKEEAVQRVSKLFRQIYDNQLAEKNCKVYYSVIPDKNYFLGEEYIRMDYEKLNSILHENLPDMTYIDITELLEIGDYYKTDAHWRQECLVDVAEKLAKEMGTEISAEYQVEKIENPFYGVYYGQSALSLEPDELFYLTNQTLESCEVYDFQNDREMKIYDMEKAQGQDPYEMFLAGSLSLVEIQNPMANTSKEIVIYRDSFASAIAPLLVEGYAKITLVDIRYISSSYVESLVNFENADVLFLYSTSVLNNSEMLR